MTKFEFLQECDELFANICHLRSLETHEVENSAGEPNHVFIDYVPGEGNAFLVKMPTVTVQGSDKPYPTSEEIVSEVVGWLDTVPTQAMVARLVRDWNLPRDGVPNNRLPFEWSK